MDKIFINLIKLYRSVSVGIWTYRPALFVYSVCKFHPTCSEYTQEAIKKYGTTRGLLMGLNRICRCNPFNKGGYDPVK